MMATESTHPLGLPGQSVISWKPNKWKAAVLTFFAPLLGMLYVNRAWLAGIYTLAFLCVGMAKFFFVVEEEYGPLLSFVFISVAVTHAYRIAAKAPEIALRPWFSRWYGLCAIALAALAAIFAFRAFLFETIRVPTSGMFPTMPMFSHVVVQKIGYGNYATYGMRFLRREVSAPLTRGDILMFELPVKREDAYIKRLIGLPGDHIQYKGKRLYVNDQPLPTAPMGSVSEFDIAKEANYQIALERDAPALDLDVTVNPGKLFLLGDNRDNSYDSRKWGQVPYDHIIGKVVQVVKNENLQPAVVGKREEATVSGFPTSKDRP